MTKYHNVEEVRFSGEFLEASIDGTTRRFPLQEISSLLATASVHERENFQISPSGYGIHWPLLDEDLSVDGLLGIVNTPVKKRKIA